MTSQGFGRSVRLFRSFLVEQTEPDIFYAALAADSIEVLRPWLRLDGARTLDVGAGPAEFATAFREAGAQYLPLDHDPDVASVLDGGVIGTAAALPFADAGFDLVFSSNLLEHVPEPEPVADEMVRVLRPGGVLFLSYTNWLSPWGGHETSPWHWLGCERAARRYQRAHGHRPKNLVDDTLFRISVAQGMRWATTHPELDVLAARPRYLPPQLSGIVRVPGLRELLTWNLLIIARRV